MPASCSEGRSGNSALRAFDVVQGKVAKSADGRTIEYKPESGADYGDSEIGRSMRSVAQLVKMDLRSAP